MRWLGVSLRKHVSEHGRCTGYSCGRDEWGYRHAAAVVLLKVALVMVLKRMQDQMHDLHRTTLEFARSSAHPYVRTSRPVGRCVGSRRRAALRSICSHLIFASWQDHDQKQCTGHEIWTPQAVAGRVQAAVMYLRTAVEDAGQLRVRGSRPEEAEAARGAGCTPKGTPPPFARSISLPLFFNQSSFIFWVHARVKKQECFTRRASTP